MLKAIIFDCDGVIAENEISRFIHLKNLAEDRGYKGVEEKHLRLLIGKRSTDFLQNVFGKKISKKEREKIRKRRYREFQNFPEKFVKEAKGIKALCNKLSRKYTLAVASTNHKEVVKTTLNYLGLKKHFKFVATKNDVKKAKLHPEIYLKVLKKLKLKADECLAIEDSATGIESAKKAGISVVAKRNKLYEKYGHKEDLSKADFVIDELKDVLKILNKLG